MKRLGKILICAACGAALTAGADTVILPGNPYAPLVARNIFGLNPPVVVDPNADKTPPPKITPNGIMSVFGRVQVLFKTAGPGKLGKSSEDESYILSQGQRQDDIEVTKIDEKNGVVTFNNHGTIQEIPLVSTPAVTGMTVTTPANNYQPREREGNNFGNRNGGFNGRFRDGRVGGNENNNQNDANSNNSNLRSIPTRNNPLAGQETTLTPEQQTLMIEAQRQHFKDIGDPTGNILPITDATPPPNSN